MTVSHCAWARVLVFLAATLTACGDDANPTSPDRGFTVVEIDPGASATVQLAVQACAGLHNRRHGGSFYVQMESHDEHWLDDLGLVPNDVVDATAFLDACTGQFPACVRYAYDEQQKLLPNILTVAAALGAVPLDVGQTTACENVAFDATVELKERNTPYLATQYVFESYAKNTTGLAMLNPGYDKSGDNPKNPDVTADMPPALVDFVFSQKLFVVFLVNGCRAASPEKQLLHDIVSAGHWPTPLGVYGYNNSWMVAGGYLYEAQTLCLDSRNMGAIPTETGNLSFFSTRRRPIQSESHLERSDPDELEYDPGKTYVAFVVGDGDNVRFLMTTRHAWLRQRASDCGHVDSSCAPLTWTISPHLARIAPDVLEWYYAATRQTGKDAFILPPSGHLYAYPTSLNEEDQARFVSATERDARVLGVNSVVHWDWMGTWSDSLEHFLPRYATAHGVIRGVFPLNVPYPVPAFEGWPATQFFTVLVGEDGSEVVVFRPHSWRGVDDRDDFFLSPRSMAERLGSYPPGTVTWVYMTTDGGLTLDNSFNELIRLLPSHVQLVAADTAARLALQSRPSLQRNVDGLAPDNLNQP